MSIEFRYGYSHALYVASVHAEDRLRREVRIMIRRAREKLQLSQGEFSVALGRAVGHPISQSQVSDWERGRREPSASVLLAVTSLSQQPLQAVHSEQSQGYADLEERAARMRREGVPESGADPADRIRELEENLSATMDVVARLQRIVASHEARLPTELGEESEAPEDDVRPQPTSPGLPQVQR